jgi:NADH-quinone oxidoreductase subunit N
MNLEVLGARLVTLQDKTPLLFGVALVLIALGFKIGAVPMHVWIPDVYQGAPTPTTAFLSVGSKAAGFILLLRFLTPLVAVESPVRGQVLLMLSIMAGATLLFGNLAAIGQTNFKRLLAYSSIAHAGFLLLALASGTPVNGASLSSNETVSFYLATYLIMTLASFFILAQIRVQSDSEQIDALNGLGKRNPALALALTVIVAALAGLPLTAGFFGKLFVFQLAIGAGLWWGVVFASIGAIAGFYYYFKIFRAVWWNPSAEGAVTLVQPKITTICVGLLTVAVLVFGVWPNGIEMLLK